MRLTVFLLITAILQVSADSFAQKITLSKKDAPLVSILEEIRIQSGYDFMFVSATLQEAKKVSIDVKDADLEDVLRMVFDGQPLKYTINERSVVVSRKEKTIAERVLDRLLAIDVRGTVMNEKGQALAGATVRIRGANRATLTDSKGFFTLQNVAEDAVLIISFLGYEPVEIKAEKAHGRIVMKSRAVQLATMDVTVNTGYQTRLKERATGAFEKPNMEIFKSRMGTSDIMARLEGLIPGLRVIPGSAGQSASSFTSTGTQQSVVRGKSSIRLDADPLYVVNGVQVTDLSAINPDDVADITVLKDAAAAAIWGVKATNGVIVITTKKGNPYRKLSVDYRGYLTFQARPNFKSNHLLSSSEYIQAARETFDPVMFPYSSLSNTYIAPHELLLYDMEEHKNDPAYMARANARLDSLSSINNQHQILDLWYQNAVIMNHTLSVSGGSDVYNFYTSLSYANNQSTQKGSTSNTYRINFNQLFQPVKVLKISLTTGLNNTVSNRNNSISVGSNFLPYQLFKDGSGRDLNLNYTKGLTPENFADYSARSRINLDYFPLDEIDGAYSKRNALTFDVTGNINLKIWKGLSFDGTYGYHRAPGHAYNYNDISTYDSRMQLVRFTKAPTISDIPVYYLPTTGGRYATTNYAQRNWTIRNQLVFTANPRAGKDNLSIQIGQERLEQLGTRITNVVRGYDEDLQTYQLLDYPTLSNGVFGTVTGYGGLSGEPYTAMEALTRNTSLFGLFSYTYAGKYILDASWRRDKSNLFASDVSSQRKPTYSIGGKWQITKEGFMQSISWLNNLGLRATYGITGNSPYVGAASLQDILRSETNSVTGLALALSSPANMKLNFERTQTINIGLDFSLFNNLMSGGLNLYTKKTTDMLGSLKTNPLTGSTSTTGNLGTLRNKGIELSLSSVNVNGKNFGWTTGLVFSYNKNKLVSYTDPQAYMQTDYGRLGAQYVVGYSLQPLFAYRFSGLDNMGDPQIMLADGTVTKTPNTATAEDLIYMGTTAPKFNGGLSNTVRYKHLSLSANLVYSLGNVMRRPVVYFPQRLTASGFSGNMSAEFSDRWKEPGDEAHTRIPSFVSGYTNRRDFGYYSSADINVIDASYIKLRDITVSYRLSPKLLRNLNIDNINLFVQSGNYMIWKANHYHVDPESPYSYINGRDGLTFSMGANVAF